MDEIILENDILKLNASKCDRPKSFINFDVIDNQTSQQLFEIYTENENLIDGNFKMNLSMKDKDIDIKKIIEAVNLFKDFIFMSFPIHKIYYETYQNDIKLIKALMENGFNISSFCPLESHRHLKCLNFLSIFFSSRKLRTSSFPSLREASL